MAGLNIQKDDDLDTIWKDSATAKKEVASRAAQIKSGKAPTFEDIFGQAPQEFKPPKAEDIFSQKPLSFDAPKVDDATLASDTGNLAGAGSVSAVQGLRSIAVEGLKNAIRSRLDPLGTNKDVSRVVGLGVDVAAKSDEANAALDSAKKSYTDDLSQAMAVARERKWINTDGGSISLGDAWKDPRSYYSGIVESIPGTILGMTPSMFTAKAVYESALKKNIEAGLTREAAELAASKTAAKAAFYTGAATEGAMSGGQSYESVKADVMKLPDSVLAQSDAYNELRAQGLSKEGALRALAEDAGSRALVLAGVTSAAFGGRGDAMLAKIFTGGAKDGLLKRVGKGAIAEGLLEEFPQSATQRLSENIAIQSADPTRSLMDDVLNQGVAGAVAGGIMGGGMASPGRIMGGKRDEPEKKPGLNIPPLDNVEDIPSGPKYDGGIDFDKTPPTNDQPTPSADELAARVAELEAETRKRQEAEMRQAQRDSEVEQFLKKDGEEPAKPVIDKLAEKVQEKIEETTAKQAKELVESRTVEPKKTTQQIIEEQTGVARTKEPTVVAAKRVTDAANEVVGVKQGEGQIEKPLTAAEDKARRVEGDASPRPISAFVAGDQVIVRDKTIPKFDGKIATIVERKNKKGKVVGLQAMVNGKPVGNPASLFEKAVAAAPTTPNATGTTAVAPTLAQMTAGNYKKAPVRIAGMEAKVETPSGVERVDKETGGKKWRARMPEGVDYGYFRRTKGADGDAIDGFFGTDTASDTVWVIDQKNEDGSFDEHKAMAQFPDEKSARAAYVNSFSDGKGESRIQAITPMSVTEFRKWAKSLDGKKQPAAEYVAQKQAPQQQEQTNEQETTTNDGERGGGDGGRLRPSSEPTVDEKVGERDARVSDNAAVGEVSNERAAEQLQDEEGQEPVKPTNLLETGKPKKVKDARVKAVAEKNSLPPPTKADAKSAADEFTPEQEALAQEEWDEQYEPPADLMGKVEEAIPYDELPPAIQDEWLIAVSNGKATQKKYDALHRRAKVEMAKEARRQRQEGRVKLEDEDFLVRDAAAMLDGDMPESDEAFSDKAVEKLISKVRAMKGKENWTATRVTPTVGKRLLAGAIGRLFGHNIVFVESNEPFFGGVVIDNTNLFISNNWPVSTSAIMGHELTHLLKRNAPELYKSLESAVMDIVPQTMLNQYEVDLGRDRAKSGIGEALPLTKVREELVADFVGDRFTEPEFWRAMAKGTGDNFAAIVYNAMAVVKRVQRFFDAAKPDLKSAAYASTQAEVNALRDVIAKTALDYAREVRQERGDSDFVSFLITAFHGTGVQGIKRLSTDYVNKGTGAQMQGWGLYLAASMNPAKRYTNSLSVWEYVLDGKPLDGTDLNPLEKLLGDQRKAKMAAYFLKNGGDYKPVAVVPGTERLFNAATSELAHIKATIEAIEDTPYGGFMEDEISEDEKEMMDGENARELKRLKERFEVMTKLAEVGRPKGALYKIDINADPSDLLAWSEPYSAQSPKVKKAIRKLLGVTPAQDSTGSVIYQRIAAEVFDGDQKATSLALRDEGVYGARYAWVDHATGEPTENYVIYDDKLLSDAEPVNYSVRGNDGKQLPVSNTAGLGSVGAQEPTTAPVGTGAGDGYVKERNDPKRFREAILAAKAADKHGASVTAYSEDEYAKMRTFLSDDGKTGFALNGNDLVSAFNANKELEGGAFYILKAAIANGAKRLDAFDTVLPEIYSGMGFKAVARIKFNDEYAPEGWNKETYRKFNNGSPDVVFMALSKKPPVPYQPGDGKLVEDYDDGIAAQQAALDDPDFSVRGGNKVDAIAPVWYSQMMRQIGSLMANQEPASQLLAKLQSWAKAGKFKADELQWSGLTDWLALQSGKVTKQQVMDYLNANGVQVTETILGESRWAKLSDAETRRMLELGQKMDDFTLEEEEYEELKALEQKRGERTSAGPTIYDKWQLRGVKKNYRELLLTLPKKAGGAPSDEAMRVAEEHRIVIADVPKGALNGVADGLAKAFGIDIIDMRNAVNSVKYGNTDEVANFRSSHFNQPNILAHIRFNERTDAEGKRVLFIEEIQSDWAQKGKKEGFFDGRTHAQVEKELSDVTRERARLLREVADLPDSEMQKFNQLNQRIKELGERAVALDEEARRLLGKPIVPTAPFVTKTEAWVALALKRMIRYAAENGFDRVAFTNGDQQAERYDLSKQIDGIYYLPNSSDGTYNVSAGKGGQEVWANVRATEGDLEDALGKEIAQKIVRGEGVSEDGVMTLRGLDLKVGGKGMKAFYDQIVPNVANDVLKKLGGGRVGSTSFDSKKDVRKVRDDDGTYAVEIRRADEFDTWWESLEFNLTEAEADAIVSDSARVRQPSFDITPAMREKVLTDGVPMFSLRNTAESVSNDPAGEIKVVPNKYRKPVEVYALKGDTIVGMATFDQDNKRWTMHISKTGEDLRTNGDINTFTVDGQPEKVIPRLREMTKADRMVRRKTSPEMPEEPRTPSDLFQIDTAYRASSGKFIDGIKAVLNIGDDEKRRAFELQRNYQDRYIYVKILQDALEKGGVKLDSRINLYRSISLYTNRAGNALEKFGERFVEPIEEQLKAVVAAGGTVKDVDDYLLSRHAKERNDHIKTIDPTNEKGSGITTKEAKDKLKELAAKPYMKHLEEIGRITDSISAFKVGMMLNSGLIDQNTANNLMKYEHYVTLKNDEDDSGMLIGGFRGGFSSVGDPAKRTIGRKTEANNVLAHTLLDAESKIMRAYKNEVNRTLLALVEAAPDPNLWVAEPMKSQRVYDEKTGTVKFVADPQALMAPNMFSAYINGEKYRIEIKDPDLVQALTTDSGNDGAFINGMRAMNRYFSTMITTLNPEWFLTNAVRDMQSTALNLKADKDLPEDITQRVTGEIVRLSKQKEMYSFLRGGKETEFTRDYQRLEQLGGITKFYGFKTLEDKAASIREMEDRALNRGIKSKAVNALEKSKGLDVIRWFEDVNLAVEAVPRVATFRALVKAGWDEKRAAEYAQNITVNFSRRGAADTHLSKFVSSGYLFFNPAVQGTVRLAQAMASPTGKKIAGALFGLGLLAAFIGHAGGDEDENKVNDYEQLTDAERAKNICIFGAKIPLPLGWNAFYAAGNFLGDAIWGKKTMAQATIKSTKAMVDAFNPFGGSNSNDPYKLALKTATPTVFDPLVELALNENNFGSPIRKQATNGVQTKPDSQMYFPSVSAPSKLLTKTLNELSGGTAAIPGAIDINPETLDYLAKTYLPGPGATALRLTNVATKAASDQKIEAREIPFARNFVAQPSKGFQLEMMRDIKTEMGELARAQKERSPMDVEKLKQYPGWAGVKAAVDSADSQIRALSTRRAEILDGKRKVPNEGQELDRISEQIKTIENRVIRRYVETKEKNRWPD